ncbi:rho guanine nucleotide exchange factor 11-like isoform X4 [Aotus nancymaae]|uniref:rho guanine nucleotide exchange factor 11-like isoform X4 n=1 Tax=Aotus nancymaae TaxID=37293 RepID=UPI0030FF1BBC
MGSFPEDLLESDRVELDDSDVFHGEPEPGELPGVFSSKAGTGPEQRVQGKHPVLLEDPKQEGSAEEEELGVLPCPSTSLDGENRGVRTRNPIHLAFPDPLFMEGLTDSALEDVENLRRLVLWILLPGLSMETQDAREPEDDVTPTPSVISVTSHPRDPGSPGQALPGGEGDNTQLPGPKGERPEQEDVALRSPEDLPPRTRNSGIWESPELDANPAEEASSTEAAGGYKVVRKGNCFYVSMPAGPLDSSTDLSGAPTSPPQPASLPAGQIEPQPQLQGGNGDPRRSPQSFRDVGMIFHTIEQLTIKLNRLKDMVLAHRELPKSLGGESSGGSMPVGSFHTEAAAARWTDGSLSPPTKEPLASDSGNSHELGPCPEDAFHIPLSLWKSNQAV